ncbi:MAG: iron-containing redox enzyme family protein [Nitrospinales bacterium]
MGFAETLIATARARPLEKSKFLNSLREGIYSREVLKVFYLRALNNARYSLNSIIKVMSICPVPQIRLHIIENLCEEEGIVINPDTKKLERVQELEHLNMLQQFSRSLGIKDNDLKGDSWECKSEWMEKVLNNKQWLSAIAYLFVGGESNVPRFYRTMIPSLKENYGFTNDDLIFFHEHLTADEKHGHIGANLLAESIKTDQEKEIALVGVKKGAKAWWLFHELCDREMRKQMANSPTQ